MKSYTSRQIRLEIENSNYESRKHWMLFRFNRTGAYNPNNKNFQFWVQNNQPIELSNSEMQYLRWNYIHKNLVEAGFVCEPDHWKWSNAFDYAGGKQGLNRLVMIE